VTKFGPFILGSLLTAVILTASLALFSLTFGWNSFIPTLIFWVISVPITANYSARILKPFNTSVTAIAGLIIFYGFFYFMTYKHSESADIVKYTLSSSIFFLMAYNYDKLFQFKRAGRPSL
jgi:hypothetical protein